MNPAGFFALRKHTAPLDSHMASPGDLSEKEISRMGTLTHNITVGGLVAELFEFS